MVSRFEDLIVYQKAYAFALKIHKFSLRLPKTEQYAMADQLRRSSKGICANIAEGSGKQSRSTPEFKRFLLMAIGSSEEMRVWLSFCKDLEYGEKETMIEWRNTYNEITKMLHGLLKGWK